MGGISVSLAMEVSLMPAAWPRHLGGQFEWPASPRAPTSRAPPDGRTDVWLSSYDGGRAEEGFVGAHRADVPAVSRGRGDRSSARCVCDTC